MQVTVVALSGMMGSGKDSVCEGLGRTIPVQKISFASPIYDIAAIVVEAKKGKKYALHNLYTLLIDVFGGPYNAPSFMEVAQVMNEIMAAADEYDLVSLMAEGAKPRRFLQLVGTEIVRSRNENAWAEYLNTRILRDVSSKLSDYQYDLDSSVTTDVKEPALTYCITDLRFPNEISELRKLPMMINAKLSMHTSLWAIKLDLPVDVGCQRVANRDKLPFEKVKASLSHASEDGIPSELFDVVVDAERPIHQVVADVTAIASGNMVKGGGSTPSSERVFTTVSSGPGLGDVIDFASLRQPE